MSGIITDNLGRASGLLKAAGGGKILQVVGGTVKTAQTGAGALNSTSYADSLVAATAITPATTSSKVLVHYTGNWGRSGSFAIHLLIYRDIGGGGYSGIAGSGFAEERGNGSVSMTYLDSPSTTSAVTYKIYYKVTSGTAYNTYTYSIGAGDPGSWINLMEVGA